jgi:hypothetical protein
MNHVEAWNSLEETRNSANDSLVDGTGTLATAKD